MFLKGRDRSRKAVLKEETALKRAMEELPDSEVKLAPEKKVGGAIWAQLACVGFMVPKSSLGSVARARLRPRLPLSRKLQLLRLE